MKAYEHVFAEDREMREPEHRVGELDEHCLGHLQNIEVALESRGSLTRPDVLTSQAKGLLHTSYPAISLSKLLRVLRTSIVRTNNELEQHRDEMTNQFPGFADLEVGMPQEQRE